MNGKDRVVVFGGVFVLILMLSTSMFFRGDASAGSNASDEGTDLSWMSELPLVSDTQTEPGKLNEGSEAVFSITGAEKAVRSIKATLTWEDEPDIRRARLYENQPDSFTVSVGGDSELFEGGGSEPGSNPRGGQGNIEVVLELSDEQVDLYKEAVNWTVTVTMTDAGNYEPRLGPGVIVLTDNGNDFNLVIEYEYYDLARKKEE